MLKYTFGIKTTLVESLRSQESRLRLELSKTTYKDLVFARSEFLTFLGDPNESLRVIIIYYMFKCAFGVKTTSLVSLWSENSQLKARFRQN